jgi:hypothetical protein
VNRDWVRRWRGFYGSCGVNGISAPDECNAKK